VFPDREQSVRRVARKHVRCHGCIRALFERFFGDASRECERGLQRAAAKADAPHIGTRQGSDRWDTVVPDVDVQWPGDRASKLRDLFDAIDSRHEDAIRASVDVDPGAFDRVVMAFLRIGCSNEVSIDARVDEKRYAGFVGNDTDCCDTIGENICAVQASCQRVHAVFDVDAHDADVEQRANVRTNLRYGLPEAAFDIDADGHSHDTANTLACGNQLVYRHFLAIRVAERPRHCRARGRNRRYSARFKEARAPGIPGVNEHKWLLRSVKLSESISVLLLQDSLHSLNLRFPALRELHLRTCHHVVAREKLATAAPRNLVNPAVAPGCRVMSVLPQHAPKHRPVHRAGGLSLCRYHCSAGPRDRAFDEQHRAFSISLVDRGVFSYRNAMGNAVLGPGWLMLGNEGDAYACSHEHGDGSGDDCAVLSFSAQTYQALQDALGQVSGPFPRSALPPLPRVAALLKTLMISGDEGFALEETTLGVVAEIQQALTGTAPAAGIADRDHALAAARYIEQHSAQELSVEAVARDVGLSPFHFMRSFRRAIGVTPHQYLIRMRLIHALALLRDTALPVTEISYATGWSDLSNFIRTFRREIGCAPREFRQSRIPRGALRAQADRRR